MIKIAHRGNTHGPNPATENTPEIIAYCLAIPEMHVEVDVRIGKDYRFWLGHDEAKYPVDTHMLVNSRVWCHAKTPEALLSLSQFSGINTFYQEDDAIAITSGGYLWCHENTPVIGARSVMVHLGKATVIPIGFYAICTDYPLEVPDIVEEKARYKLVILDVDGVMTDGRKIYAVDGSVAYKQYCDRDFTAIKRLQAAGVIVVLMSGDASNGFMASSRNLPFIHTNYGEKRDYVLREMKDWGASPADTVFVGDDYYDMMAMTEVAHRYCPADAIVDMNNIHLMNRLRTKGGDGVVAELYEKMRPRLLEAYPTDSADANPK